MIKIIVYTLLFSVGGYYAASYIPDSVKGKFLSAIGFPELKEKGFEILNPAAKRAEILQKLETNVSKLERFQSAPESSPAKNVESPKNANIKIEGAPITQEEIDSVIEESKTLLEEMKELNPKTGILSGVVGKVFKVGSDSQQQTVTADQITQELKEQICK